AQCAIRYSPPPLLGFKPENPGTLATNSSSVVRAVDRLCSASLILGDSPMNSIAAVTHRPLIDRLWPVTGSALRRQAVLAVFGSLLLWASSKAQFPMWPVPMTMQSAVVLVIGMA